MPLLKIINNMKILGTFLVVCLFFACQQNEDSGSNKVNPYLGKWAWEKSDSTNSFSIEIIQKGDSLLGTYCGVVRGGAKMDCGIDKNDIAFWFKATNDKSVTFDFQSYRENDIGKASLSLEKEYLVWKVIQSPKTEHYAWKEAKMLRLPQKGQQKK